MSQPTLPLAELQQRRAPKPKSNGTRSPRRPRVIPMPDGPVERHEPGFGAPDLLLEIPNPDDWISANRAYARTERAARALAAIHHRLVEQWQNAAWAVTKNAKAPQFERVRIVAWRDAPNVDGHHDPSNYAPTAKAAVDGLVRAGLLPDDNWKHLIGPDMRRGVLYPAPGRLVLGIYDLTRRGEPATITDLSEEES